MQNISAVLDELGLKWVDGYAPRRNIGAQKSIIIDLINEIWARQTTPERTTADPEALATRVASARSKLREGRKRNSPPTGRGALGRKEEVKLSHVRLLRIGYSPRFILPRNATFSALRTEPRRAYENAWPAASMGAAQLALPWQLDRKSRAAFAALVTHLSAVGLGDTAHHG